MPSTYTRSDRVSTYTGEDSVPEYEVTYRVEAEDDQAAAVWLPPFADAVVITLIDDPDEAGLNEAGEPPGWQPA